MAIEKGSWDMAFYFFHSYFNIFCILPCIYTMEASKCVHAFRTTGHQSPVLLVVLGATLHAVQQEIVRFVDLLCVYTIFEFSVRSSSAIRTVSLHAHG